MSRTKNATKPAIAAAYAMDEKFDAGTPMVEVKKVAAPEVEAVVIDTLDDDSKLRLSIKGGKFAPVVLYRGVADVDGVACLVGHDVEYNKERVTPVDTLAKVEVKAKRYVEVPVALLSAVALPERVSEVKFTEMVDAVPQSEIDAVRADQGGLDGVNDDEIAADLARLDV